MINKRILLMTFASVLLLSMVTKAQFAALAGLEVSEETQGAYDVIEALPVGSVAVLSFDFGPSTLPENRPQAKALLFHCEQRGLRMVALAFWASGGPLAHDIITEVHGEGYENEDFYGTDIVYLGYVPGSEVGMQTFGDDTWSAKGTDHFGTAISDLPLMQECRSAADFDLWIELTSGTPGEQQVIQFIQGRHPGENPGWPAGILPLVVGATAVSVPGMMPFYYAGQIIGILNGLVGAAEYEYLLLVYYEYEPSLVPYPLGVKAGVWVRYGDFAVTWESEDPSASPTSVVVHANDTQWVENTVQAVSGVNVRFQTIAHYKNDTEQTTIRVLNADAGDGNGTFWFILTCMEPDETIYTNSMYTINETISRTYAGFTREVNHLNITQTQPHHNSSHNLYWDKISGTLTEWTIRERLLDNGYLTSWSISFEMVATNLWKTINVPNDYLTIQEAVDAAVAGDTVRVAAEKYSESVVIRKSLALVGEDRETTVIDGGGAETVMKILASYVTVSGFTIQNGKSGIATGGLSQRGIAIRENILTSNTGEALYLSNSHKGTVRENVISSNHQGLFVSCCNNTAILSNVITQSSDLGFWLAASSHSTLRNNQLSDNYYNFMMTGVLLEMYIQDIDTSNTIDGKPMLYLLNQHNVFINSSTFPDVGYLAIVNCTDIHVSDIQLTRNEQTFLIAYTNSSTIRNVAISHSDVGIRLEGSCDNVISGCVMQQGGGIWVRWGSHRNNITSNVFVNNSWSMSLQGANDTRLLENTVQDNEWDAVTIGDCHNTVIAGNSIVNNTYGGISLSGCMGSTISDNTIAENGWYTFDTWEPLMGGLRLYGCEGNTLKQNNLSANRYGLLTFESSNNVIYHNNFINNAHQLYDASWESAWYPPSVNTWDNGYPSGGNFWSDYTDVDLCCGPYQNETGSDGIWDHPNILDEDNQDGYPLVAPWPSYQLNIGSLPVTGIPFTIDGEACCTPYVELFPAGSYVLEMPETYDEYVWAHWLEDGDTNRTKIVTMPPDCAWTGVYARPKELSIKLTGEHDYVFMENVKIRVAALVTDAETMAPVSGVNATIEIYDPEGNLWLSDDLTETPSGTGIYEWHSTKTIRELMSRGPLTKGVYLAHVQASYRGGPVATDILQFHIDPPGEAPIHLQTILLLLLAVALATGISIWYKDHRRLTRKPNALERPA